MKTGEGCPKEGQFVAITPFKNSLYAHTYRWKEGELEVYHKVISSHQGGWYKVDERTQFTSETTFFVKEGKS